MGEKHKQFPVISTVPLTLYAATSEAQAAYVGFCGRLAKELVTGQVP